MLEPQSTVFLVLLVVVFAALMWWLIVSRRMVLRIIAACLAFIPAMAFGVAGVNKYYDYYQTWGAAIADVTASLVHAAGLDHRARRELDAGRRWSASTGPARPCWSCPTPTASPGRCTCSFRRSISGPRSDIGFPR